MFSIFNLVDSVPSVSYDSGWIARSDWTNVHMGSSTTKNADSNLVHNLNSNLSDLIVRIFASSDGTDANSLSIEGNAYDDGNAYGYTISQVDANTLKIQTGTHGFIGIGDDGGGYGIDAEDWYYKVKVYRLF